MTAIGFVWALSALEASEVEGLFILGVLIGPLAYALFLHMLVAFPTGRLQTPCERLLVGIGYFDTTVIQVLALLFHQTAGRRGLLHRRLPGQPADDQRPARLLGRDLRNPVGARRVRADRDRGAARPPLASGAARLSGERSRRSCSWARPRVVLLGLSLLGDVSGFPDGEAENVIDLAGLALLASVPFAFLTGLMRSRLSRAAAVSDLVSRLGEADRREALRDALAEGLGDPSLSLVYWVPDQGRYVDAAGHPVELPADGADSVCTYVEHDGPAGGRDLPRRFARRRAGAGPGGRRRRRPGARERAPQRRAARPGRGAARLAGADRARRPTTSAAGSSATSTTAPSSAWSPWR